jgi:hypothetical protein
MRNSVIWRMLAWFLLLALIPLGAVMIFVQRQVNQTVLDVELRSALKEARLLAVEATHHPDALEELTQTFGGGKEIAIILGTDGRYVALTDREKAGTPAVHDSGPEILGTFTSGQDGQRGSERWPLR